MSVVLACGLGGSRFHAALIDRLTRLKPSAVVIALLIPRIHLPSA